MGGCRNYGPFLGTLNIGAILHIIGTQKGTIILTTTHMILLTTSKLGRASTPFAFGATTRAPWPRVAAPYWLDLGISKNFCVCVFFLIFFFGCPRMRIRVSGVIIGIYMGVSPN